MYRHAWHAGLKTTYYLRTLGASNIEESPPSPSKKRCVVLPVKQRQKTATRDAKDVATAAALTAAPFPSEEPKKRPIPPAEKNACSIEAMKNGEICEGLPISGKLGIRTPEGSLYRLPLFLPSALSAIGSATAERSVLRTSRRRRSA